MKSVWPHLCGDWDEMYIYPGCPEMDACACGKRLKKGDVLQTEYIPGEGRKNRIVEDCYDSVYTQTGFWVKTEGLPPLDAAWFREPIR